MAMNVDPDELVAVAARAAELARTTGAAIPRGWVMPAGADPISAEAVPRLNAQAGALFNGIIQILNQIQKHAHNIGAAAVDYTRADDEGGRRIGGKGSEVATNPVPAVEQIGQRRLPPALTVPPAGGSVDPLTFAQQLHNGPGPGSALRFADSVRTFAAGTYAEALGLIDHAAGIMRKWTPVGTKVADDLTAYRGVLDQLGSGLGRLAEGVDSYGNAFRTAKAKHPTPQEIIAARKQLVAAMRSKNQAAVSAALAKFQEQNARSAETVTGYTAEVESKVPAAAADAAAAGAGTGGATGGAEQGGGSGSGSEAAMMQMLPALLSAMGGMGNMAGMGAGEEPLYDDYASEYDDLGVPDFGSAGFGGGGGGFGGGGAGGIPSAADVSEYAVGPMPTASTTGGTGASSLPRAPVIEPLAGASSSGSGAARGAGMPMMPYMPMAPGAGGAGQGNNERNRVVAWHPDRLMYVDDTPHTEAVIGERPTIAPTVTAPTPTPGNQAPTQSGGSA
ncbi:PPE domain-containing protein [Nocardia cyriacigeorgica]|uniref:PPE domain-containing protein n=1 Tax=Nocardia cyriacigeorgica TaxID=135487 RepID=UPI00031CBC0C|nr:PPE domain-containing protein [Nocardia cyriacigeorgica]